MTLPRLIPADDPLSVTWTVSGSTAYGNRFGDDLISWPISDPSNKTVLLSSVTTLPGGHSIVSPIDLFVADSGTLLFLVQDAAGLVFAYRSTDGGTSWGSDFVFRPGWTGSVHRPNRGPLGRTSFATGSGVDYFAEYRTELTPGQAETFLWKSTDDMINWTVKWDLNPGGTEVTKHMHSVYVDPFSTRIVICTGDSNNDSGVIIANPSASFATIDGLDTTQIQALSDPDFIVYTGAQRHRQIDLIFKSDFIYGQADCSTPTSPSADVGIWRFNRAGTVYERVLATSTENTRSGGGAMISSSGVLLTSDYVSPGTEAFIDIHASETGELGSWSTIARLNLRTTRGADAYLDHFFEDSTGQIYCGVRGNSSSGKNFNAGTSEKSTVICNLSDSWDFYVHGPEPISPTYWVNDATGVDSTKAGYVKAGYATVKFALEGNEITNGARVIFKGTFDEDRAFPEYDNNLFPSDNDFETVISREDLTSEYSLAAASADGLFMAPNTEEMPIKFLGGGIRCKKAVSAFQPNPTTKPVALTFAGGDFGNAADPATLWINNNGDGEICYIKAYMRGGVTGGVAYHDCGSSANAKVLEVLSIWDIGKNTHIRSANAGQTVRSISCVHKNHGQQAIEITGTANIEPEIVNLITDSPLALRSLKLDAVGITGSSVSNTALDIQTFPTDMEGANSLVIGTPIEVLDTINYIPLPGSPLISAGLNWWGADPVPLDRQLAIFADPPAIGASSFQPLSAVVLTTPYIDLINLNTDVVSVDLNSNITNNTSLIVTWEPAIPSGLTETSGVVSGTVTTPTGTAIATIVGSNSFSSIESKFQWTILTTGDPTTGINVPINS